MSRAKISGIRLHGYKSCADPVDLPIPPGITAIVGPNGCGKSNVIEGLKWGQGEASARKLRADSMDDVIFGGTDTRPARASAEVTIRIEGLPAPSGGTRSAEISRKLTRGDGSTYRIDGKETRARDVKALYQDAGMGAGSMAHISQGAVGSIISAKPSERRSILEEAAGVAGLSAKRHEADLRLNATEQNLERAEDLARGLGEQVGVLRRQARQAARKRSIDELVRAAEATSFLVRIGDAASRLEGARASHAANEDAVGEAMLALRAAEAEVARLEREAAPVMARRMEAETALAVARAGLSGFERDAAAVRAARAAASRARERAAADAERERLMVEEASAELEEIADRVAATLDDQANDAGDIEYAAAGLAEAEDASAALAEAVEGRAAELAGLEAARRGAETRRSDAAIRMRALDARLAAALGALSRDRAALERLGEPDGDLEAAAAAAAESEEAVSAAEDERVWAVEAEERARAALSSASAALSAAQAEARGLRAADGGGASLASSFAVRPGYEEAVAAALGEGLRATLGAGASRWWEASPARVSPPEGVEALSPLAGAPGELAAALSGVGVAPDGEAAARVSLLPGQSVVTPAGELRRWDGYRSSGTGSAGEEMRRAARLRALDGEEPGLAAARSAAAAALSDAVSDAAAARAREAAGREALRRSRSALDEARRRGERAARERAEAASRIASGEATAAAVREERSLAVATVAECDRHLGALADPAGAAAALSAARTALAAARAEQAAARAELERVRREADTRAAALSALGRAEADARRRRAASAEQARELDARAAEAAEAEAATAEREASLPGEAEEARAAVEGAAAGLEGARLASAGQEAALAAARTDARTADARLSGLREERARLLAETKAAQDAAEAIGRELADRMGVLPEALPALAGLGPGAELPDLAACDARLARLVREREALGAVNPLAEEQVAEMEARIGEAQRARDDLRDAVRRLRQSMAEFDREARERLAAAFALVDGHFRDLFGRLFRGGHAHLSLSGSDDPLTAGLEIYACPPGKRLQTLSLMSGGEQALAALALVFAAFMVSPAPVCVLDEVDAPLDDANVDRLCSLVADMARGDATRFLFVTHNALTMARADRLVGVTMAERGVSRVVSLDLAEAARYQR